MTSCCLCLREDRTVMFRREWYCKQDETCLILRIVNFLFYLMDSYTLDQRFPHEESEEREPLVARSEAFQMIGPIKLSRSTGGICVCLAGPMNIVHKQH